MIDLDTYKDVQAYFHELLTEARSGDIAEFEDDFMAYLVRLLSGYLTLKNDPSFLLPLVERLKLAVESADTRDQFSHFRNLGDCALFLSGFFHEYFGTRGLNRRYLSGLGEQAYASAGALVVTANSPIGRLDATLFFRLSERFRSVVETFERMRGSTASAVAPDMLRLIHDWQQQAGLRAPKRNAADREISLLGDYSDSDHVFLVPARDTLKH